MKTITPLLRFAVLTLIVGTACISTAPAQTTATPPPPGQPGQNGGMHAPLLTPEEKAQLTKDRDAVLAANPDLKTEGDNLKKQYMALRTQGDAASQADKDALKAQGKAHEQKMRAAILAIDPSAAAIFAKLDAARKARL